MSKVITGLTLGINTRGNNQALSLAISSVLSGSYLPQVIRIRTEADPVQVAQLTADFYLQQLAALGCNKGCQFDLSWTLPLGIRKGRDWHFDQCSTEMFISLDDDVIIEHEALGNLLKAKHNIENCEPSPGGWSFICGNKRDVNNIRGYKDFSTKPVRTVKDYDHTNLYYDGDMFTGQYVKCVALDTGFAMFNMNVLRHSGLRFNHFKKGFNAGGEDNFFGILCTKAGFPGFFAPSAQAYHLEKPRTNFGEQEARAESIIRSAEAAGIADGVTEFKVFPALERH